MGDTSDPKTLLTLAADEDDWPEVVRLLEAHWSTLISEHPVAVRDVVESLPPMVLETYPRWAMARDYLQRIVPRPGEQLTRFRGTASPPRPVGFLDQLAQLTSRGASARAAGDLDTATESVTKARELLDAASQETRDEMLSALPEVQFEWGMVWEYAGDFDQAIREYVDSFDEALRDQNGMARMVAAGALAWIHALCGRNLQARHWLDQLPEAGGEWWNGRSAVPAIFARTLLLIDGLHFDEARAELAKASLAVSPERWPFQKLLTALVTTDPTAAMSILAQIDGSAAKVPAAVTENGPIGQYVAIARSILLRVAGQPSDAARALPQPSARPVTVAEKLVGSLSASQLIRAGNDAAAGRLLAIARADLGTPRISVAGLALTAVTQLRDGDRDAAAATFASALSLADERALFHPLTAIPRTELLQLLEESATPLDPDVAERLVAIAIDGSKDPFVSLTRKERQVLILIVAGTRIQDVATELFVSVNTVKSQLASIYRKTGTNSRDDLTRLALTTGTLD